MVDKRIDMQDGQSRPSLRVMRNGGAVGGRLFWVRGFTLIELMIVVVIIGVIAAVAIPSYRSSIQKSNRSAAKSALLDLAAREEKYYTLTNSYSSSSVDLYGTASDSFTGSGTINIPMTGKALYTIAAPTVVAATSNATATFSISAVPTGSQTGDQCGTFTLNSLGQQTVSGSGSCW